MIRKWFLSFILAATALSFSTGCNTETKMGKADIGEAKEFISQNYINFQEGSPARLISCADGYSNNGVFGTTWSKDNLLYDSENGMTLLLEIADEQSRIKTESGDPYVSAEMRSLMTFRYGFFGTYMKPSNVKGTASTFFLYASNPHDEIDIEFLGKDTTKVQFNYFKNDGGGNEYWYDLGFDASEEYHHYGFYWGENELCWYVDFQPVYRLVGENCPSAKCQLMANHWAGNTKQADIIGWMGNVNDDECPSLSSYQSIQIADQEGNAMTVLPKVKEYNECPSDDKLISKPVTFKSVTAYTVIDKTSTTEFDISYKKEDITSNYRCVKLTVEGIADMKWVQFKIKNLHEGESYPALCRLTVDTYIKEKGTNSNKFLSAWKNGATGVQLKNSNLEAHYELAMGEEATMTFRWYGEGANELTFMFDDFGDCPVVSGKGQRDGHLKISDFKFGGVQDYVAIDTSGYVDELYTKNGEIEDPESEQAVIPEEYTKLNGLVPGSTANYVVTETEEGILLEYNQPADGYEQCGYYGSNIFNGAREIILVIKNNHSKEVTFQLKIKNSAGSGLVSSVDVISNASTGRFVKYSGSAPGVPYLAIAGGRTCQFHITITDDAKSIAYVMSVASALQSSALIKGIYAKTSGGTPAEPDPTEPKESIEFYGKWEYASYATCSINSDGSTKVSYNHNGDSEKAYEPLQCTNFGEQVGSSASNIKTITIEVKNLNNSEFHGSLCIKDNSSVITSGGSATDGTGDVTWKRHSSGNGEYYTITANGNGTITAHIESGKVPTKLRMIIAYNQLDVQGEIEIGKITIGF